MKKFVKISNFLDKLGFYSQADKVDQFVKIAQFARMPSQYEPTGMPQTNNPLIDSALSNLGQSAFGYELAGGRQFKRDSPYKSDIGPTGPAILPTLSPTQFAKMEQEGRFQDIFDIQLQGGMQAQNYLAQSNENLIGLSTVISQYADPKVNDNVRQSFFQNVLPGTISRIIAQDLEVRPFTQWSQRLEEYLNILGKSAPNQMPLIRKSISSSFETILKNKAFENQALANQIKQDPKWNSLSKQLNLSLPEASKI
jgi:hypothetical protein